MATISLAENEHGGYYPSTALATHTFTIAPKNVVLSAQNTNLSGSDISLTVQVKYNTNAGGRNYINDNIQISCAVDRPDGTKFTVANYRCQKDSSLSANTNSAMTISTRSSGSIGIGGLFNSSNPTVKTIPLTWTASRYSNAMTLVTAKTTSSGYDPVGYRDGAWTPIVVTDGYVTLDAPPTFDVSALSMDTSSAYAGATTASVTVSNLSAKYGGSITEVKLTIGNQTATRTDNGTLSIALGAVGTFTPTVTVTDSRGQVTTQTLEAITVGDYTSPSVSIAVQRTLATGVPNDEGEYGTISATFEFVDVIAQLAQPTVTVDGTSATVTWYSTRATDGTLSGTVNWASLTSPVTVYGIVDAPNIQTSYQLAVTPNDSISSGTPITQTLASAFYTIDFLAGGHGIAFGQPATQDGFFCNMDSYFKDHANIVRALFDFIHPVGSYYETSDTSFNPNTTWGGTWVLETEGQVHVSAGTNYAVNGAFANASDGGESEHTLTIAEMPSHAHWQSQSFDKVDSYTQAGGYLQYQTKAVSGTTGGVSGGYPGGKSLTGGGQAHNNMQPYIIVNRWHRTA